MKDFSKKISEYAIRSMLYELTTSPKPGLVDRYNSGAHDDMDIFTFINSISVLPDYFYACSLRALSFKEKDFSLLMEEIRPLGIDAEKKMFKATQGVNTHKGMVFSLGIICAAAGSIYKEDKKQFINRKALSRRVSKMTRGISQELKVDSDINRELTYGERLYRDYKIKGIRGEVESGFATVLAAGLPLMDKLVGEGYDHNTIFLHTLINLMSYTEDSNILGRHDFSTLEEVRSLSKKALKKGGALTSEGMDFIRDLDRLFIERNISSGGAADLLAVTIMFYLIEKGDILNG